MCGIAFKVNLDGTAVNNAILDQYDKQSHRGKQGFGLFAIVDDVPKIVREAKEKGILKWLCRKDSHLIMFHHRFPTSTINVARAAHPHSTHAYFGNIQYVLVHNGVIRNAKELFTKHQEMGIEYGSFLTDLTFNDSEALLWDFALTMEGQQEKMTAYGDMAFIAMKLVDGKLERMYFGRNNRPLHMYRDKQTLELSSEGRGADIDTGHLYNWNYKTKRLTKRAMEFPSYKPFRTDKHSRDHYGNSFGYDNPCHRATGIALPLSTAEYNSMDDYWSARADQLEKETRSKKAQSNWDRLRNKFGPKITKDIEKRRFSSDSGAKRVAEILTEQDHVFEATKNADGTYSIVAANRVPVKKSLDIDDIMSHKADYEPTTAEIQTMAMGYLIESEGHFENAYALLEFEYEQFLEDIEINQTFDDVRKQLCMESAMEFINSDPEYINENSVSSVAEALWFQQIQQAENHLQTA